MDSVKKIFLEVRRKKDVLNSELEKRQDLILLVRGPLLQLLHILQRPAGGRGPAVLGPKLIQGCKIGRIGKFCNFLRVFAKFSNFFEKSTR